MTHMLTHPLQVDDGAPWDAIVVAGGRSSRLGGIDKVALLFEGESLVERALRAVAGARRVIVVGPPELRRVLPAGVDLVTENPRFGGPASAIATGVSALGVSASRIAVIAADMPRVTEALPELFGVGRLAQWADGVVASDAAGRVQPLLAIYSASALARAIAESGELTNASMRSLISRMLLCQVLLSDALCADIDTPTDAERHHVDLSSELAHV